MVLLDVVRSLLWSSPDESSASGKFSPTTASTKEELEMELQAKEEAAVKKAQRQEREAAHLHLVSELVGAEASFMEARDGTTLKVFTRPGKPGPDHKVMLVLAPLGQQDMLTYLPVINHFGDEYTYISFQYRGFFESEVPKRHRRVSVRDHAEDALDVLKASGFASADVIMAHSMGVQVALEFVLLYPECASSLILMNGSYGTVFNNAFQPFFRVPFAGSFSEWLVDTLVTNNPHRVVKSLGFMATCAPVKSGVTLLGKYGNRSWIKAMGATYLADVMRHYVRGIGSSETSSLFWLRGFQELNAHSVKHLLPLVEHPTLMISGKFDYLTPSWAMDQMAAAMPNAIHRADWYSTHFTVMENPDFVVREVDKFLRVKKVPSKFKRISSVHFSRLPSFCANGNEAAEEPLGSIKDGFVDEEVNETEEAQADVLQHDELDQD